MPLTAREAKKVSICRLFGRFENSMKGCRKVLPSDNKFVGPNWLRRPLKAWQAQGGQAGEAPLHAKTQWTVAPDTRKKAAAWWPRPLIRIPLWVGSVRLTPVLILAR